MRMFPLQQNLLLMGKKEKKEEKANGRYFKYSWTDGLATRTMTVHTRTNSRD